MDLENQARELRRSVDDPKAFAALYSRNSASLLKYFMRRVFDAEAAFDLTAETFAQAYLSRARFRGSTDKAALAWLYRIASRQLSRYQRKGAAERRALARLGIEPPLLDDDQRERIEALAGLDWLRDVLRVELDKMSRDQQNAIRLRVVDQLSYSEVAARLNISEQTARSRVSRGLRTLASTLERNPTIKEAL